ncbi:galactosyl transferase [Tanacetum coccineum]
MTGGWAKLPAIRAALVAHPEAEWIWWLDEDTVITDMEYRIPFHKYKDYNFVVHGVLEHYSWLGKKMLIETRYYLEEYWILIVDTFKNITERYLEIEKSDRMLRRRHAEKVSETYSCQPCIGKRTRNPSFTLEGCKNAMDKALNFADNQIHAYQIGTEYFANMFCLFKVPIGVLRRLEAVRSKSFRGGDAGARNSIWFSWDKVIASKVVGG